MATDVVKLDGILKKINTDIKQRLDDHPTVTPTVPPTPVLSRVDETNHNFIKKILSLSELIDKTDDFVKDIQHVNEKIINRKFFPGSYRCPTLTNLKSFISSMVNNAINQKNKQKFYHAIEYLHAFKSIIVPAPAPAPAPPAPPALHQHQRQHRQHQHYQHHHHRHHLLKKVIYFKFFRKKKIS